MSKTYQPRDESNRRNVVTVRFSDDELEQLHLICELLGEYRSKYIRRRALTGEIDKPVIQLAMDENALKAVTGQLGKIGSNLNQIARRLNSGEECDRRMKDAIGNCISDMDEMLKYLRTVEAYRGYPETPSQP